MGFDARKIAVAVLLLIAAASSWWLSRKAAEPQVFAPPVPRHVADYSVENFNTVALDEHGRPRYRLTGKRLVHYSDDDSSEIDEPYLVHYAEGGPVHARAAHAWIPGGATEIVMTGDVRVSRDHDPQRTGGEITAERMRIVLDK